MKAMILAAGFGTRLKELTKHTPKALINVGSESLLGIAIKKVSTINPQLIVINAHYKSEMIVDFINHHPQKNKIKTLVEKDILGTGGGILNAKAYLESDDCLIYNTDILTDFDLHLLANHAPQANTIACLLTTSALNDNNFLFNKDGLLIGHDKIMPVNNALAKGFCGIYVIYPRFWQLVVGTKIEFMSIVDIFLNLVKKGYVIESIDINNANWLDVGTVESLKSVSRLKFLVNKS